MKHEDLPVRWAEKLERYLKEKGSNFAPLSASDFGVGSNVHLKFDDGSYAFFKYAFYLVDEDFNEVAIFTEHCGYHIFTLSGTTIELLESRWPDEDADL